MSETERDPALDAAWREAGREEPPAALDDAIRAAARREVNAAPRGARDKHWWYPLAAAATVAVIAIGLLQVTPPERVAPTVTTDTATAPQAAQREALSAPAPRLEAAGQVAPAPNAAPPGDTPAAPAKRNKVAPAEAGAASGTIAPPAPPPATSSLRSEPFPAAPSITGPAPRREAVASEGRAMRNQAALAKDASAESAKPKQAPARSVDDWIKLIRDLRLEGKLAEATKELAAFRDAYGERADSLLPADLRELKAQGPAAGAK